MKSLVILTTKAITHNRFLDSITKKLISKYDVILACKDIYNLNNFGKLEKYNVDFPLKIYELFDLKHLFLFFCQLYNLTKKVDLIYVHTPLAAHSIRIIRFFIRRKIKIIYHVHGLRYIPNKYDLKSNLFRLYELILSCKTDVFIVINKLDYFSITKFVNKNKVFLVNGVGINIPKKIKITENDKNNFIIGVISAFKKEKGFDQLFEIAKLLSSFDNIFFYIYGSGNASSLNRRIKKERLKNIIVKGFVDNIENEIKQFTIFLHPSHREGLNVSIQECLSRGIPVITTNARGCKDLIIDGYNGYTYEIFDIDRAINLIISFYNMKDFDFNRVRRNCVNYARKNFDRQMLSNQIEKIINQNE